MEFHKLEYADKREEGLYHTKGLNLHNFCLLDRDQAGQVPWKQTADQGRDQGTTRKYSCCSIFLFTPVSSFPSSLTTSVVDDAPELAVSPSHALDRHLHGQPAGQRVRERKMREPNVAMKLFAGGTGVVKLGVELNNMDREKRKPWATPQYAENEVNVQKLLHSVRSSISQSSS
ncbi:hypothetical protein SELMODRAFT_422830 [Selaginella moellendorffii]|uniref:Uncharacterized protein n=1 Tax=Selaginella moellendorffii TaxID=88036 RepID=D8SJP2_SELML|nr:hypothetical protein SELMODRAFT_422830 [Selaginella moellendorffii]